jgi:hypothetical protein
MLRSRSCPRRSRMTPTAYLPDPPLCMSRPSGSPGRQAERYTGAVALNFALPSDIRERLAGLGDAIANAAPDVDFAYRFGRPRYAAPHSWEGHPSPRQRPRPRARTPPPARARPHGRPTPRDARSAPTASPAPTAARARRARRPAVVGERPLPRLQCSPANTESRVPTGGGHGGR